MKESTPRQHTTGPKTTTQTGHSAGLKGLSLDPPDYGTPLYHEGSAPARAAPVQGPCSVGENPVNDEQAQEKDLCPVQLKIMSGRIKKVFWGTRRLYNYAGDKAGNVPKNTALNYDTGQKRENVRTTNGNKSLYRITEINADAVTNQALDFNSRNLWVSIHGIVHAAPADSDRRRGQLLGAGPHQVVDGMRNAVGTLIEGAEFDYDQNQVVIGPGNGVFMHPILDINKDDIDAAGNIDVPLYIAPAHVQDAGGQTYGARKQQMDRRAGRTTERLKAGRPGAELGIGHSNRLNAMQEAAACYNFAVGSFNNNQDHMHMQAAVPQYVVYRYGGVTGVVISPAQAINGITDGAASVTPARAAKIDRLLTGHGVNLNIGAVNPDYFGPQGNALKDNLREPLQKFILRESGLRPNPEGNWAVGFRYTHGTLGSDHAWLMALVPGNENQYITFDTFPEYEYIQANRKRHSDPFLPRDDESDYKIRITGPTVPQWTLVQQVGNVGGPGGNSDDRTNLHPQGY